MKVRPILPLVVAVGLLAPPLAPRTARAQQGGLGAGQAASSAGELYYALVIGNNDYSSMPKLETAAKDARAVARVLRESYGFQTKLLVNATRSQIVAALSAYRRELGAGASLLIYYAGRGRRQGREDKAYWLPVDAAPEDVTNRITADEVTAGIRDIPARHVLVVSNCCCPATLPGVLSASPSRPDEREQFLHKMSAGRSRTLMASCGEGPAADDDGSGHSAFAAALLRGLRKMGGPRFTASELFVGHVLGSVASRTGQIPFYDTLRNAGHESGDFVFKRIKPSAAPGSCEDQETKSELYKKFLDSYKGNPEQQKVAYEAGKDYVSRYDLCPEASDKNVVGYIRNWLAKYEAAVREWQRGQSRRP